MSSDMLATASPAGHLTRLNPAWERTLGWTREELTAEPLLSFVHPDDAEATAATLAALAGAEGSRIRGFENRYRTAGGRYLWFEWSAIAEEGVVYFAAKDVTARKALEAERAEGVRRIQGSEALNRTLTANLPDTTVFLLDHDLRILLAEGEAVRRLSWCSEDLFIGRLVRELHSAVPAHVLDLASENYLAVLQGERRRFQFSSEGATFAIQGVPVYSADGGVDAALIFARDVTEQQRLADGLRRSDERLRRAEGLVGGGSWEFSLEEETLIWSDGLCHIHGETPEGGRERLSTYVERVHPADRTRFRDELARCEKEGRTAFEYRIAGRDGGSVRTLTVEAELVDPGGEKRLVRGTALDVTDERAGFDAAPLGMLVTEPAQLRTIRVNDSLCSILQRSREELLGRRISDFTHPDDRSAVTEKLRPLLAGTVGTSAVETRYLRPDGSAVWVAVSVTALHNADGSVRTYSSYVIDITERRMRGAQVHAARVESLRRLAIASEYRDNETYEHTERVGRVSVAIGRALAMSESQLDLLREAAPLHDIGKVGISDVILLKPGRLTPAERQIMERHTLIGADILTGSESSVLQMAEEIARTHHERWDGRGYPNNLAAEMIPLVGRIVAVADVFDALTHERPYKEAWPLERAIAHITAESGSHFDPAVVDAFSTLDRPFLWAAERPVETSRVTGWTPRLVAEALAAGGAAPTEERIANRDAAAAARDRAAADRDQNAAERDQCEAEADERTSIRDAAAADRDRAASRRADAAFARDLSNAAADVRTTSREQAASERELAASERDVNATQRDHRQATHDQDGASPDGAQSPKRVRSARGDAGPKAGAPRATASAHSGRRRASDASRRVSDRNRAETDRELAALDRVHTGTDRDRSQVDVRQRTSDRADSASDRTQAAADEALSAANRGFAQSEADTRWRNRDCAALDRALAAVDRNQTAADRTAATLDRDLARDELRQARIDPLTGALGRALGSVALGREINRARHGNGKLVLAFIDVDGLKQVNDRHGHGAGDLLLREVVDAIQKHLRSYDPVVRMGGDEFVCALVDATADQVRCRFEKIQATIDSVQSGASISFGLAELRSEDSLQELIARGDRALLQAKEQRRQARNTG
jgi:diguanylate cyclase (GGDEF)-like protein/PAS domain S-box-containing protein